MPIGDPRFEDYLKTFRPVDPPELALKASRRTSRSLRFAWTCACAMAVILIVALLIWHRRLDRIEVTTPSAQCCASPLTLGGANASIFGTASTTEVLDRMVFPQQIELPKGRQSALSVLSQEKAEL
jgi:hypothetical protein